MNKSNILIGVFGLFAGVGVYVTGRAEPVYFLKKLNFILPYFHSLPNIYGKSGGWVPEFFHAFSFSLITIGLFSKTRRSRIAFCLLWFGIDSSFELGQNYGVQIASYIPSLFNKIPVLERTQSYFINGRFDLLDVLAIFLGVLVAYLVSNTTAKGGEERERNCSRPAKV